MVFLKDMSPSHMAPSRDHDADAGLLLADDALPDAHMVRAARLRRLQLGCVPNDATNATAPDRVPVAPQTPVSTVSLCIVYCRNRWRAHPGTPQSRSCSAHPHSLKSV
jgi:hypothetical protein